MYSGENNLIEGLVFGIGPPAHNYTFELKIQIADKFGAKAEQNLEIKVSYRLQSNDLTLRH